MTTINLIGTGGYLEGDLNDTNINVDTDAALYFDGTGDFVTAADSANYEPGTGDFSVSYWANMDSGTTEQHIMCKRLTGSPYTGYVLVF